MISTSTKSEPISGINSRKCSDFCHQHHDAGAAKWLILRLNDKTDSHIKHLHNNNSPSEVEDGYHHEIHASAEVSCTHSKSGDFSFLTKPIDGWNYWTNNAPMRSSYFLKRFGRSDNKIENSRSPMTKKDRNELNLDASVDAATLLNSSNNVHRPHGDDDAMKDHCHGYSGSESTQSGSSEDFPNVVKLIVSTAGIYLTHLYAGYLQEDVFLYVSPNDGSMFDQAWFLQMMESVASVVVSFFGIMLFGLTFGLPLQMFWWCGAAQVSAKAYSNLALASGLDYPTMMLAKSAKMAPVMIGSMTMGGASYKLREYLQVAAIILGTIMVSFSQAAATAGRLMKAQTTDEASTKPIVIPTLPVLYILLSLVFDGVVAGFQKRLKRDTSQVGIKPTAADFMFWFSVPMALISGMITLGQNEFFTALEYCFNNPELLGKLFRYSLCSAMGSAFIFYTLAHFDPLVVSTITTTRKIFSIFLSIVIKGHGLSPDGWMGITLACLAILSELCYKQRHKKQNSNGIRNNLWFSNSKQGSFLPG